MALKSTQRFVLSCTVNMLLSSIAIMNIGDDEEDGLQDATPISLVDLFGGLRHVSCLQQPTVKVLNFSLLVWSSFLTAHLQFQQNVFCAQFSSTPLQLPRAQHKAQRRWGQGLTPLVHTTFTQQPRPLTAHSDVSRFSVHWLYMLNFQLRAKHQLKYQKVYPSTSKYRA